jgi:hypothetical protein
MPDGHSIRVSHPEWIAYAGGRIAAVITGQDGRVHHIDVMLADRLEFPPPVPAASPSSDPKGHEPSP